MTAPAEQKSLDLNEQIILREQLEARWLAQENKTLRETLDVWDRYVDPLDAIRDEHGVFWSVVATVGKSAGGMGMRDRAGFLTEQELAEARLHCRLLAETSEFAINVLENRISYTIGNGHTYTAVAKKGETVSDDDLRAVQTWLDNWLKAIDWTDIQQETRRRLDRDGEAFLRMFEQAGQDLQLRFVEPWQVYNPPTGDGANNPKIKFGIEVAGDDVQSIEAYWIDGERVEAGEIQHRKENVDRNVRRGIPTLWAMKDHLRRAGKMLYNIAVKVELISAIALIRKHAKGVTQTAVGTMRDTIAAKVGQDRNTGQTKYAQAYKAGTILDSTQGTEYEVPNSAAGVIADSVAGLAAVVRGIASRVVMPEFMVSSDASNANYSSTMVAEGPAVKMFERLQGETVCADCEIIDRGALHAIEAKTLQVSADVFAMVEIQAIGPQVTVRDRQKENDVNAKLNMAGILSSQSWSQRAGLDYEQEQKNIEEHRAAHPDPVVDPKALPSGTDPNNPDPKKPPVATREGRINAALKLLSESYP